MNETGQAQLRCVKGRRERGRGRRQNPEEWRADRGSHAAIRPWEARSPTSHACSELGMVTAS